ncbi:3-hydroxyacyl-CoA dehydrogenase NAD-binding domain-containing protein [Paractinoplanes atraurantiacus]|uniref:3-hydroxyacyl-CoA dehydrogenase / enoyl-CoA hydratase / 3-hydroxybutyryl-CoA epimerase n=1 Tax=Paractinoplanes atraurantiacus TaxID=1036182 RepID=A0A285KV50_9ACTN|nr:3-hydroxyacyl-CoA dehydrogenase NAD-binding domain-containing protein [Actinoplanes atraurantiacus]SNY75727.1 3-hydroxyacyl-CoA dehydrogenase / enoyl-CoA hydratase / 3-hydroxybutyryl-CoA epimerase [Actinoplanes atraurantiacus]
MAIHFNREDDGIIVLTFDDPDRAANTMNEAYVRAMQEAVSRLEDERDDVTGVILASAKKSWFAGGDLDSLRAYDSAQAAFDRANLVKAQLRRLETLGRPVVAAINGAALGGGLEIALACHRRIALPGAQLGCPEVTLGLLPAGGGVVRTVRLLGLTEALTHVLLPGTRHQAQAALEIGLLDQIAASPAELMSAAREWIRANPDATQPWESVKVDRTTLPALPAVLRQRLKGAPYPAPRHILAAAVESTQVDVDTAFVIESRYFAGLVTGHIAKNMISAFFFDRNAANAREIGDLPPPRKAAVLGAGMMGAGIAQVLARAGVPVVLRDVDYERAAAHACDLITPTADVADLAGADLVIEAVFEDPALKHKVFAEIEGVVAPDALLCSNTSTLPITALAEGVRRDSDFIGLHFFSPVPKMPLVEVIRGEKTSDEALGRALAVVRLLRKTPIVVNDSRGFFTSRVIGTFTNEGVAMLAEGVPPASIEQASSQAGYPAPVLALMDELTLTLPRRIREEALAAGAGTPHPADAVIDRMIDEFGRPGRSSGAGFYEYAQGRRVRLWPGLSAFGGTARPPFDDLKERLLFIEAIETVKCLDEGVLTSVAEANIGSILGIGYPGWTGGVLRYIDQYEGGLPGFVARARQLAGRYGDRFDPPPLLLAKAAEGTTFG